MSKSVRAKFKVVSKKDGDLASVTLAPVMSGSSENEDFYKYTPGGSIQLSTVNQAVADAFEINKEYYVDFTEAPEEK